jgi:Escherichia/Staphylococcus phage prohead protease
MLYAAHAGRIEVRRAGGDTRLSGRFPYGERAVLSDGGRTGRPQKEVIEPEAFSYRVDLPDEDIHLLFGHDFDMPLASKLTDTLMLKDSPAALTFEAIIPPAIAETTHGRDVLALITAGLAIGLSPGFRIPPKRTVPDAEEIEEEEDEGPDSENRGAIIRHVRQALLYELSIVTRPAYSKAQVQMRNWTPDWRPFPPTDSGLHRALNRWRA